MCFGFVLSVLLVWFWLQVVAHSSETELKGQLVSFVTHVMRVATVFTGDGKNDVRALELADVSFAFPSQEEEGHTTHTQATAPPAAAATGAVNALTAGTGLRNRGHGSVLGGPSASSVDADTDAHVTVPPSTTPPHQHDPEVAASASAVVSGSFWQTWKQGHGRGTSLAAWGAALWTRVYISTVLLLLKQGLTAGINVSAAAATAMLQNRDPYMPVMYQVFNLVAFALVIGAGVFTPVAPRLHQPLLSVSTVAATSMFGYVTGCAAFAVTHWVSHFTWLPSHCGDGMPGLVCSSTLSLVVAFVALVGAAYYQYRTRSRRTHVPRAHHHYV